MNEVPNIISTKDLSYIKDMMNWEFVLVKKANHYEDLVNDKEIKSFIKKISKKHKEHYEKLLGILE